MRLVAQVFTATVALNAADLGKLHGKQPSTKKACTYMLEEKAFSDSGVSQADMAQCSQRMYDRIKTRSAFLLSQGSIFRAQSLDLTCKDTMARHAEAGTKCTLLLRLRKRMYDESPTRCRIRSDGGLAQPGEQLQGTETTLAKALQVKMSYHYLLTIETANKPTRYAVTSAEIKCPILCLERTTAATLVVHRKV